MPQKKEMRGPPSPGPERPEDQLGLKRGLRLVTEVSQAPFRPVVPTPGLGQVASRFYELRSRLCPASLVVPSSAAVREAAPLSAKFLACFLLR